MQPLEDFSLRRLNARFGNAPAEASLAIALDRFEGQIALLSSFGADSAVLLHMLSRIDAGVPVIFVDTQMLFPETLDYQRELATFLGLRDCRRISPDEGVDPEQRLHQSDSLSCCELRKRAPLEAALSGFAAVITGRKRFQTGARVVMETFEQERTQTKVNPLANWTSNEIADYFDRYALPRHPLVAKGYPSIGCAPCTSATEAGEDPRAGRWRNEDRQECGIHFGATGQPLRKVG